MGNILKIIFNFWILNISLLGATYEIGSGTSYQASETHQFLPGTFTNAKVQILLTASELSTAGFSGDINAIEWYVETDNTPTDVVYDIYIGHIISTTLPDNALFDTTSLSLFGNQLVDVGSFTGWHGSNLTTNFTWNGTSNILIQICRTGNSNGDSDNIAYFADGGIQMITGYSNSCSDTTGTYSNTFRPFLRISSTPLITDTTPPTVTSILPSGSPTASDTSVTFTASFSEDVINIDTSDFELTTTGTATGNIVSTSVSSGTSVDIVVNTISGVGNIRLDLVTSHNLTDSASNALSGGYNSGTVHSVDFKPISPSDLVITAINDTQMSIDWVDNSNNEDNFILYSSTNGIDYELNETLASDTITKLMMDLTPNTIYYFQIGAINSYGENNSSIENNSTFATQPIVPINIGGNSNSNQIELNWNDSSTIETGFKIYTSTDGTNYSLNTTVGANTTNEIITGLSADTTYYFKINSYIHINLLLTNFDIVINTQTVTIKTNDPANFTAFTNLNKNEDFSEFNLRIIDLTDNDSDNLVLSVENNDSSLLNITRSWNANLTSTEYNSQDFNITFTSIANTYGVAEINVSSYDGKDYIDNIFQIVVNAVNDIPIITSITNIYKDINFSEFNISINIDDVDTNELNITVDVNDTSLIDMNQTWDNNLSYEEYHLQELNLTVKSKSNIEGVVRFTISAEDNQLKPITTFDLNISAYNYALEDLNAISIPLTTIDNIDLSSIGAINSSNISWISNNTEVLNSSGVVNRQINNDVIITLTATLNLINTTLTKNFDITVIRIPYTPPPYVESESESVVEEITTDSFSEDSGVTLEISEDGSTNFNVTSVSESGEVVETQTELPSGTEISINEAGEIEQSFVSEDGTEIKLTTSQTGKVTLKVTTANGEEVSFEAPAGTKLKIAEDGSSKQDYSTKDSKTELKISATGESELNLKSEDGNKVELKSELAGKTELKESGGFKQSFETGDNKISIEGSKQANSQAVIELPNLKLTLTPPKNGKVSVKKDGSVSIANDTITSIGTVKSEMRVNPDTGDASVEVNIQSNQRGVVPKKIFYSTRKDISNIKLEVILDERKAKSRAFNSSKSKTGKIKAVFSTRKSFNFKENISREVSNSSLGVTPLSDAEFEENLYFDNSQELKLKSGSANIKGFFSTRGSFSNKRKTTNTDLINNRDFSMKSNSAIMSENNIIATLNEGNLKTDLQANSNGDLNINITNFTNTKRGLKTTAKKLFYSVRKDFSNVKVEIIENSNQRGFKSPKIKTLFSTRESFNFKSSNLRTVDEIEIIPVDENTTFTENILEDGSRYIELISGTASINSETMILNKSYELPALELIEVVEDLIINQEVKLELQKEWNLISTPISEDISDKFIFQDYDLIWNFKDNNWVKNPSILYYEDGYWIKTDSENNITFKGSSYTPNLKRVVSTWALVGTGTEINDINNLISEEKIKEIYQFKDNKWLKSNDINSLNIGDGFWIKKIPADFIFNIKEGWNLLSLPTKEIISNMSIFGDYEEILIYDNKEWIKNPNQIKPMQGFWINSNENISLAFYGEGYNIDINSLSIGWSLVGGNINFENLKFSEIKSILLFKNDKWTTVDSFKNIDLIKKADGFWILK